LNIEIRALAPREKNDNVDYGDCFIINENGKVTLYDCGSEELAEQVLVYLENNNIKSLDIILSHNDNDHFGGIPVLVKKGVVNSITTLLLLKYKDEIYDKICDKRVTKDSLVKNIKNMYNNIYSLSGQNLIDALDVNTNLSNNLKIVGPETKYFVEAVAKQFTPNESNSINNSTIMNAISVQLEVNFNGKKLLLTGDADFEAFDDKIRKYDAIQLPHHGNEDMALKIFEKNEKRNAVLYIISDNKGSKINGGSDNLKTKGYRVINTKTGELVINKNDFNIEKKGTLNSYEIYNFKK